MAHTCSASSLRFNSLIFSPNPNPNPSSVSDSLSLSLLPSRSRYSIFVFSVKFIIIKPFIFIIIFQIWSSSKFGSVNLRTFRLFNYLSIFFFGAYWCSIIIPFALGSVCFLRKCLQIVMNLRNLRTIRGCGAEETNQILVLA